MSRPAWGRLAKTGATPEPGSVLAAFERACHLVAPDGEIVSLVLPEVGDGPLNIVVERPVRSQRLDRSGIFQGIQPGMDASLRGTCIQVGELEIVLDRAQIWEPRPDWERLRTHCAAITSRLVLLHACAVEQAPKESLLSLISQFPTLSRPARQDASGNGGHGWRDALPAAVMEGLRWLAAGWEGDDRQLQAGAACLAGLGGGLTPAGDDFLCGLMLWSWLAYPRPRPFCQMVASASELRTTTLSAGFLRAAADGQCSAAWHRLLGALEIGTDHDLAVATQDVLSHGHTSGADALAGFVWMGLQPV